MKRAENGSIRYHRGGWELAVWHEGRRTIRRHRGTDTRAGRRSAEDALDLLSAALPGDTDRLTVADVIELHRLAASPDWSPSTRATQPHHAAPVLAAFGDVPLARLARVDIQRLYDQ